MNREMSVEPNGIGFALGGLAGNNAHGAGFLQAALDTGVIPEMISCTSGQLLWVWYYLRLLNNDHTVSGDGTLERRFQDEVDKLSPLALIFDAVPTPWPLTEDLVRRAADLSRDWPFARDFTWWWLTLFGKKDRYQPCLPSLWLDILRNAGQSTTDLLQKMLTGRLGDAFLVEFLANIAPNRVLKPDFRQEFFDKISDTFNSSGIGIVFNSYQPGSGEGSPGPVEYLHINEVAREKLGRQYGTPASYRAHTTIRQDHPRCGPKRAVAVHVRFRGRREPSRWRLLPGNDPQRVVRPDHRSHLRGASPQRRVEGPPAEQLPRRQGPRNRGQLQRGVHR